MLQWNLQLLSDGSGGARQRLCFLYANYNEAYPALGIPQQLEGLFNVRSQRQQVSASVILHFMLLMQAGLHTCGSETDALVCVQHHAAPIGELRTLLPSREHIDCGKTQDKSAVERATIIV